MPQGTETSRTGTGCWQGLITLCVCFWGIPGQSYLAVPPKSMLTLSRQRSPHGCAGMLSQQRTRPGRCCALRLPSLVRGAGSLGWKPFLLLPMQEHLAPGLRWLVGDSPCMCVCATAALNDSSVQSFRGYLWSLLNSKGKKEP